MTKIQELLRTNMQEARNLLGFSQLGLANEINVSPSYIGEIEKGKKFPSAKMLQKIADALKLKPYQLFLDKEDIDKFNREDLIRKMYTHVKDKIDTDLEKIRDDFLKLL